jgi:peptidoglycan/LPS O-acetylase OafA/YrhL
LRRQHLVNFLWARILRIFPAYLFCLVLCAYLLGAIYTTTRLPKYLGNHALPHYVIQNLKLQTSMVWTLPGVFEGNPKTATVNGAIWTLPGEFRMYLWVALTGLLGVLSRRWLCTLLIATLAGLGIVYPEREMLMIPTVYLGLAGMFGLGVFCYVHRQHIPVGWPYAALAALLAYLLHDTPLSPFVFGLALAQFAFAFAYCTPWYGFNRLGDYSYGIYLWGFPMQQVVAHQFPALSPNCNAGCAFPLAWAMAFISWHIVEKPALSLKNLPERCWTKWRLQFSSGDRTARTTNIADKIGGG